MTILYKGQSFGSTRPAVLRLAAMFSAQRSQAFVDLVLWRDWLIEQSSGFFAVLSPLMVFTAPRFDYQAKSWEEELTTQPVSAPQTQKQQVQTSKIALLGGETQPTMLSSQHLSSKFRPDQRGEKKGKKCFWGGTDPTPENIKFLGIRSKPRFFFRATVDPKIDSSQNVEKTGR